MFTTVLNYETLAERLVAEAGLSSFLYDVKVFLRWRTIAFDGLKESNSLAFISNNRLFSSKSSVLGLTSIKVP